jgi:hypothetical protein
MQCCGGGRRRARRPSCPSFAWPRVCLQQEERVSTGTHWAAPAAAPHESQPTVICHGANNTGSGPRPAASTRGHACASGQVTGGTPRLIRKAGRTRPDGAGVQKRERSPTDRDQARTLPPPAADNCPRASQCTRHAPRARSRPPGHPGLRCSPLRSTSSTICARQGPVPQGHAAPDTPHFHTALHGARHVPSSAVNFLVAISPTRDSPDPKRKKKKRKKKKSFEEQPVRFLASHHFRSSAALQRKWRQVRHLLRAPPRLTCCSLPPPPCFFLSLFSFLSSGGSRGSDLSSEESTADRSQTNDTGGGRGGGATAAAHPACRWVACRQLACRRRQPGGGA